MTSGRTGFTLLELIIVVGILAALVALAMPYYQDYVSESKHSVMRANLHTLRKALMDYHSDNSSSKPYPADLRYLADPTLDPDYPTAPTQKYLLEVPVDPEVGAPATWGYVYNPVTKVYSLDSKYDPY